MDAELSAAGLLEETPGDKGAGERAHSNDFEPMPFSGRPLSEQIIAERR